MILGGYTFKQFVHDLLTWKKTKKSKSKQWSQISPLSTEQGIPQLTAQNQLAVEKVRNDETSSGD